MMGQQIGQKELALRAQREAHYQQTHKSKRAVAKSMKSKIEAVLIRGHTATRLSTKGR